MQSVSIYVSNVSELNLVYNPFSSINFPITNHFYNELKRINHNLIHKIRHLKVTRLYFGNEFCEYLLPSTNDLDQAIKTSLECDIKFTLVTPYVTDYGLVKIDQLVNHLIQSEIEDIEVVFNDWGTLQLLRNKYHAVTCIAGRLLDKMIKDPRISKYEYEECFTQEGLKFMRNSNLDSSSYQKILNDYNIKRVELDLVPQGFDFLFKKFLIHLSIYIPFGFVTTGRVCMMRSLQFPLNEKYILENKFCEKNCQNYNQIMKKQVKAFFNPKKANDLFEIELFRKGNTVFFENNNIEEIIGKNACDRVIFQPIIPM